MSILPLTYENLLQWSLGALTLLLCVGWKVLQNGIVKQLDRTEKIEKNIVEIKESYVMKEHMRTMETEIKRLEEDKVSKGELKLIFSQLDKSIMESGHSVRDALARVHVRIDDIYKEMFGSRKG